VSFYTLRQLPGVDQVASFGNVLHVSGVDGTRLQASLTAFVARQPLTLKAVEPSLEDAFIHLMQDSQDQFRG